MCKVSAWANRTREFRPIKPRFSDVLGSEGAEHVRCPLPMFTQQFTRQSTDYRRNAKMQRCLGMYGRVTVYMGSMAREIDKQENEFEMGRKF